MFWNQLAFAPPCRRDDIGIGCPIMPKDFQHNLTRQPALATKVGEEQKTLPERPSQVDAGEPDREAKNDA